MKISQNFAEVLRSWSRRGRQLWKKRIPEMIGVMVYIVIFNGKRGEDFGQMEVVDYARAIKVKTRGGLHLQEPVFTREGLCQVAPFTSKENPA
jgi:hypothetical protein